MEAQAIPGFRAAPRTGVIEASASAGSFLDGGANRPFQNVPLPVLKREHAVREMLAIQKHFSKKREYTHASAGDGDWGRGGPARLFYVWANLAKLPVPLNKGMSLFREGLKEKVITVSGEFFDVNPGNRRVHTRCENHCRISFGPELKRLEIGLDALERVIVIFRE